MLRAENGLGKCQSFFFFAFLFVQIIDYKGNIKVYFIGKHIDKNFII